MPQRTRPSVWMALGYFCLWDSVYAFAQSTLSNEPNLTDDQKIQFLLNAKVIASKQGGKSVTHPWKLTLTDGTITHDASFQPVDEHKTQMALADGRTEINFVDSYHYNIAGYDLARMLGMNNMVPP